jgi:hypothetical protein
MRSSGVPGAFVFGTRAIGCACSRPCNGVSRRHGRRRFGTRRGRCHPYRSSYGFGHGLPLGESSERSPGSAASAWTAASAMEEGEAALEAEAKVAVVEEVPRHRRR